MPQGKVIEVKPPSLLSASSAQLRMANPDDSSQGVSGVNNETQVYIIGKFKKELTGYGPIDSVLWYEGAVGELKKNQKVKFEIIANNPRPVGIEDEAYNVVPLGKDLPYMRSDFLAKVALFAASLLIFAVFFDKKDSDRG